MNYVNNFNLKLHEIRSLTDMENLHESWNHLVQKMPTSTPFQTWEWNYGIAKFESDRVSLRIVVAETDSGEVVGIAPFWIRSKGIPGLTVLEFIGTWRSDYLDLLFLEPYRESFIQDLGTWVHKRDGWKIVDLQSLRPEAVQLINQDRSFEINPFDICPYAQLPTTMEEYEANLPGKLRSLIRRRYKRLTRDGALRFSISRTPSEMQSNLPHLFALHQRRQTSKDERGRFFDRRWQEAFSEMSLALSRADLVRLGLAWINDEPAASLYNLRMRDREYFYMAGMEPSLAHHSPGNLLHHRMIGEAIREGVQVYDFLRGNEPYKFWWTNETCEIFQMVLYRSKPVHWVSAAEDFVKRRIYRSRLIKKVYLTVMGSKQ